MNQDTNREDRVERTDSQEYRAGLIDELIRDAGMRICLSCGKRCDLHFNRFCQCAAPEPA